MSSKIIITNLAQFLNLVSQHPELLHVPPFKPLEKVMKDVRAATASCGCNAGPVYAANKNIFVAAINSMQPSDHLMVRTLLRVGQVCYGGVDGAGKYKLNCY